MGDQYWSVFALNKKLPSDVLCSHNSVSHDFDWLRATLVNCDRLCAASTDFDRLWPTSIGFDRLRNYRVKLCANNFDRLWSALIDFDRLWSTVSGFVKPWLSDLHGNENDQYVGYMCSFKHCIQCTSTCRQRPFLQMHRHLLEIMKHRPWHFQLDGSFSLLRSHESKKATTMALRSPFLCFYVAHKSFSALCYS